MERYVLDTSIFTNPDVYRQFGETTLSAVMGFLRLAKAAPAEFYMPTSVYDELRHMKDIDSAAPEFELIVRIRSPRRFQMQVPADILYEFIEEVRVRIDRGLRVAEEHAKMGRGEDEDVGRVINRLRERYRETLRRGILDSAEDVDVLLLAYELDGVLVSADDGLRKWADKVGVKIVSSQHFGHALESLAG
ncbi:MAG: RNA ligase partner protein [Pseudomonadota bacterium]|nr:MAG: RNA ligase partner protein [Pseudomonadota bacterium]